MFSALAGSSSGRSVVARGHHRPPSPGPALHLALHALCSATASSSSSCGRSLLRAHHCCLSIPTLGIMYITPPPALLGVCCLQA